MTCPHDPTYRIENESNGGSGCPLCNRYNRNEQRAAPAEWFVSASVTLELSAAEISDLEARCAETATEAPDYPGMWM